MWMTYLDAYESAQADQSSRPSTDRRQQALQPSAPRWGEDPITGVGPKAGTRTRHPDERLAHASEAPRQRPPVHLEGGLTVVAPSPKYPDRSRASPRACGARPSGRVLPGSRRGDTQSRKAGISRPGPLSSRPVVLRQPSQGSRGLGVLSACRSFAAISGGSVFVCNRHPSTARKVHLDDIAHSIFSGTFACARDQRPEVIPV